MFIFGAIGTTKTVTVPADPAAASSVSIYT